MKKSSFALCALHGSKSWKKSAMHTKSPRESRGSRSNCPLKSASLCINSQSCACSSSITTSWMCSSIDVNSSLFKRSPIRTTSPSQERVLRPLFTPNCARSSKPAERSGWLGTNGVEEHLACSSLSSKETARLRYAARRTTSIAAAEDKRHRQRGCRRDIVI